MKSKSLFVFLLLIFFSLISFSAETKLEKVELLRKARKYIVNNMDSINKSWKLKIDTIYESYNEYSFWFNTYYENFVSHNRWIILDMDFNGNILEIDESISKNRFVEINIKYTRKEARDKLEKFLNGFYMKYYKTKFKYPIPNLDDLIKNGFNKSPSNPACKTWVSDLKNPIIQKTGPGYGYGFYKDFYRSYYPSNEIFLENMNWKDVVGKNNFNNYPRLCWLIPLDYERRYAYVDCETCEIIDVDSVTNRELLTPIY